MVQIEYFISSLPSVLEGGNVKFRPDACPEPFYAETYQIQTSADASVKEGAAIVFGNTIPHRFRMIKNSTAEHRRRTFINFFIVDPNKPLPSTKTIPSTDFLKVVLTHYASKTLKISLPIPIATHIIKFVPGAWGSIVEAKKFRAKAREAMIKEKTGWGWINWVFYFDEKFFYLCRETVEHQSLLFRLLQRDRM